MRRGRDGSASVDAVEPTGEYDDLMAQLPTQLRNLLEVG
jgi:hypothetical protein